MLHCLYILLEDAVPAMLSLCAGGSQGTGLLKEAVGLAEVCQRQGTVWHPHGCGNPSGRDTGAAEAGPGWQSLANNAVTGFCCGH